jgi:predicted ABC-type ATPase
VNGRRCGKGKPCGLTCIERIKECLKEHPEKVSQALRMARTYIERAKEDPAKELEIQEKLRAQGVKAFYKKLLQDRGDGKGSHLENPNEDSFKLMTAFHKFSENRDARLNRLEGREMQTFTTKDGKTIKVEPKRWYPDSLSIGILSQKMNNSPTKARRQYEERIIEEALAKGTKSDKPQAIMMVGGPASGKSTLIKDMNTKGFVTVDADEIKAKLPEFLIGVGLGDKGIANSVHQTSARISSEIIRRATERGLNVLVDSTGANLPVYKQLMDDFKARENPYNIRVLAQHVPKDLGVNRAVARAELPLSMGGGRFVPRSVIESGYDKIPGNFLQIVKKADSAILNDGVRGKVISEYKDGESVSSDARAMREFVKAAEGG